jgi:2-polyprenyl-3-methyl-5-hydroxy-6-metoxy-1,4-benzoquinol methylase
MSIYFNHRSTGIEIMDDLDCKGEVVDQTLRELDFINHWLGGNAVTLDGLKSLWKNIPKDRKISIADLGCGSCEMLRLIAQLARKDKREVALTGIDANPNIASYAQKKSFDFKNIQLEATNIFSDEFRQREFDIILGTLFLHHFTEEELIGVFSSLKNQARYGIIINDVHRHPLAYYSIKYLTELFSKSAMVKFDAPLSVLRSFKKEELKNILQKAGIEEYQLKWKWAFRWQLVIPCSFI